MRRGLLPALTALALGVGAAPVAAAQQQAAPATEYVVVYAEGVTAEAAQAAVAAAGGTVVKENAAVGVATVQTTNPSFVLDATARPELDAAAAERAIGFVPRQERAKADDVERLEAERAAAAAAAPIPAPDAEPDEPLGYLQWDMEMIDATPQGSYAVQRGDERVLVGIMDTGIDASHPDVAPNFDARLSRNFTTDDPLVDGPCEDEPDASCEDPADVDENDHGTHVAGTVGAPINDLGIAGVAPDVTLVNVRAGQDSGYFFLQPTVDALTYSGDVGIDVVNMSFYIDPWLYNCTDNPADSAEDQIEQRTIIEATQRALDYAHAHGVTLMAAMGNGDTDLGDPRFDDTSPDYPPDIAYPREVDNSCLTLPTEGNHVISVSALGPSERKAYYSDYGVEQTDLSAPGGDFYDFPGTSRYARPENIILAPYPESLAIARGDIDADGLPTNAFVVRDCRGDVCGYYQYLQGTSMASPHAAGVASLVVSEYGRRQFRGGFGLRPDRVERILDRTAVDHACPEPPLQTYIVNRRDASGNLVPTYVPDYDAYCEGSPAFNGFYGEGIVNALTAVSRGR